MPFGAATDVAYIEVKPSIKGWDKTVRGTVVSPVTDRAGREAGDRAGNAFTRGFGKAAHGAGTVVKGVLGAAGVAGGALLGTALTKGFSRLTAIDNAKAKLTGLGNSAKDVDSIMKNALASVKGTAFGMDEAATTAAGSVAAGIKPGVALEKNLKLVADAATIAGTDMSTMGSIFNKVATSNKIQGDVIAQLSDAGIPVVQMLSKQLGVSAEQVVKLASAGKINFAQFQGAMEKGLGGAAQSSGKTFTGAMKNIQASLGRIGANLLGGIFPQLAPQITKLTKGMEPLEAKAKVIGQKLGVWFAKGLDVAIPKVQQFATGVTGLFNLLTKGEYSGALRKAFGWEEDSAQVDKLLAWRDRIIGAFNYVKFAWQGLTNAWKTGDVIDTGWLGKLEAGVAWLSINLPTASDKIKTFFAGMNTGDTGSQLSGLFEKLKNADFSALGDGLKRATSNLGELSKLGPVVSASGNMLSTTLGFLADHADTLAKFLPILVGAFVAYKLAQVANNTVGRNSVIGFYLQTAATLALASSKFVEAAATRAATAVRRQELAATAASTTSTNANTAATNVGVLTRIRQTAATAASRVATVAATVAQRAMTAGQWLLNAAMSANPVGLVVLALIALGAVFVLLWKKSDTFRNIVTGAWNAIKDAAFKVWGWLRDTLWPGIKSVWDSLSGAFITVKDKIVGAWNTITDKFTAVKNWVVGVFKSNWDLILGIITGPIGLAVAVVRRNWDTITSKFTAVKNWVVGIFKSNWDLILGVITGPIGLAVATVRRNWDSITDKFTAAKNWVMGTFKVLWDGVKKVFTDPIDSAKTAISNILGATGLQSVFTKARDAIGRIWDGIKAKLATPINAVIGIVNNPFIQGFNNILSKVPGVSWRIPGIPTIKLATGGMMPGYTPGRDVHRFYSPTAGFLELSGGEPVLRPEAGRVLGRGWVDGVNAAARSGGVGGVTRFLGGYAKGGVVGKQSFDGGGWWDKIKGVGSSVVHKIKETVSDAFDYINPKKWLAKGANALLGLIPGGGFGDIAKGVLRKVIDGFGSKAEEASSAGGGSGVGGGGPLGGAGGGMGWRWQWDQVRRQFPSAILTSSFRPGAVTAGYGWPSNHARGRAIDVAGPPALMSQIASWLASKFGSKSLEIIYSGLWGSRSIWQGRWATVNPVTQRNHYSHVHWGFKDGGAVPYYERGTDRHPGGYAYVGDHELVKLPSGSQVYSRNQTIRLAEAARGANGTGSTAGGGVGTINVYGVPMDQAGAVAQEISFEMRRTSRGGKYVVNR